MKESEKTNMNVGGANTTMTNDGVVFELTQKDFLRLNNMYKRTLKENDLTDDVYVFDDFMRDVFTAFINKIRVDDIKVKVSAGKGQQ